jgi:hypothetical protein
VKKHRVRAPLTQTICPKCGSGPWSGSRLRADDDECPDCIKRHGDKAEHKAKFAPSKRGALVAEPGTEVE